MQEHILERRLREVERLVSLHWREYQEDDIWDRVARLERLVADLARALDREEAGRE